MKTEKKTSRNSEFNRPPSALPASVRGSELRDNWSPAKTKKKNDTQYTEVGEIKGY